MLRNTARSVTRTLTLTNARLPVPRTLRLYSQQEQNPNIPPPAYSEYQWYETQKFRVRFLYQHTNNVVPKNNSHLNHFIPSTLSVHDEGHWNVCNQQQTNIADTFGLM
jgi:hypothetical protein